VAAAGVRACDQQACGTRHTTQSATRSLQPARACRKQAHAHPYSTTAAHLQPAWMPPAPPAACCCLLLQMPRPQLAGWMSGRQAGRQQPRRPSPELPAPAAGRLLCARGHGCGPAMPAATPGVWQTCGQTTRTHTGLFAGGVHVAPLGRCRANPAPHHASAVCRGRRPRHPGVAPTVAAAPQSPPAVPRCLAASQQSRPLAAPGPGAQLHTSHGQPRGTQSSPAPARVRQGHTGAAALPRRRLLCPPRPASLLLSLLRE
jgi:hypothetical protein